MIIQLKKPSISIKKNPLATTHKLEGDEVRDEVEKAAAKHAAQCCMPGGR